MITVGPSIEPDCPVALLSGDPLRSLADNGVGSASSAEEAAQMRAPGRSTALPCPPPVGGGACGLPAAGCCGPWLHVVCC